MMLKNYFKVAFRNFWKNKSYSAINIFGLAIGLATCLMITLFVTDELSYDRYNKNADRIYRVNTEIKLNGSLFKDRSTPAPMADVLFKDYPQIEQVVRLTGGGDMLVKKGNETVVEQNSFFADPALFEVFTLPLVQGDPKTALSQPDCMVISEAMAKKYFKNANIIGQTLTVDNTTPYKITGVVKETPSHSHLHFNFIKSMSGNENSRSDFWLSNSFATYVLLRPGTTQQMLDYYLKEAAKKYAEPQVQNLTHSNFADLEKKGGYFKYTSIPLTGIHLFSDLNNEAEPSGNIQYVYIFILIAAFILLIACVNFTNLSTARSAGRAKEVGIRKVLGSGRTSLIAQFLTESVLTSFLAMVLALIITNLCLPYFNQLSGKEISPGSFLNLWLLPSLLFVTIGVGLLAGLYPAFFLSAFKPIKVLKGKLSTGFKGSWLRNGLVVFQFATAIVLIVSTLVIYRQLNYIQNKSLGYSRNQVLILKNAYSLGSHAETFKNEVLQIPGVVAGTRTNALPTSSPGDWNQNAFSKDASMSADETVTITDWSVDADYLTTLGMQILKGRNFSPGMLTDSSAVLINETAARLLGFPNALQEKIYESGREKGSTAHQIIGVVKDFNAGSLRYKTSPILFRLSKYGDRYAFKLDSKNIPAVLTQIENKYHAVEKMAGQPFIFSFMNDDFNRIYQSEQRTGKIFISFTFFVILIACLGLFGLITYASQQRIKEIGVRKVLGASVANITSMLSKDFLKLVLYAIIVASPVGWYVMQKWLQSFAYRTNISWQIFALATILAICIGLATVCFQAIKAAIANPVKSLRTE